MTEGTAEKSAAQSKAEKVERTVHMFMELWPLWILLAGFLLNYIHSQGDIVEIK